MRWMRISATRRSSAACRIWGINAYDQPGVELGKRLAARMLPDLANGDPVAAYDASTNGLVNFYKANRDNSA